MERRAVLAGVTDEELMRRVAETEDVDAFSSLYDRHAKRALGVARSVCGDSSRSEEAVQEGFLSIWRGRARYAPRRGSFQAWSMSVVRNAAVNRVRYDAALSRPRLSEEKADAANPHAEPVIDRVIRRNDARELRSSLARLPEAQAEVISLAFFGELSHSEIAEQLDIPPGTVKGRMRLGLEKLRSQIDRAS